MHDYYSSNRCYTPDRRRETQCQPLSLLTNDKLPELLSNSTYIFEFVIIIIIKLITVTDFNINLHYFAPQHQQYRDSENSWVQWNSLNWLSVSNSWASPAPCYCASIWLLIDRTCSSCWTFIHVIISFEMSRVVSESCFEIFRSYCNCLCFWYLMMPESVNVANYILGWKIIIESHQQSFYFKRDEIIVVRQWWWRRLWENWLMGRVELLWVLLKGH